MSLTPLDYTHHWTQLMHRKLNEQAYEMIKITESSKGIEKYHSRTKHEPIIDNIGFACF